MNKTQVLFIIGLVLVCTDNVYIQLLGATALFFAGELPLVAWKFFENKLNYFKLNLHKSLTNPSR